MTGPGLIPRSVNRPNSSVLASRPLMGPPAVTVALATGVPSVDDTVPRIVLPGRLNAGSTGDGSVGRGSSVRSTVSCEPACTSTVADADRRGDAVSCTSPERPIDMIAPAGYASRT